ncbi:hypothetical protein [Falsiroseomonas sp. CW058]|uniref:hypothetical protein n=1 Tax=Falsiroseomonas sp. CW058 TaxID=3388664 RepID=UPI003D321778
MTGLEISREYVEETLDLLADPATHLCLSSIQESGMGIEITTSDMAALSDWLRERFRSRIEAKIRRAQIASRP